jgi:hypothetical protein
MAATDPDIRIYRNGELPSRGREAGLELLNLAGDNKTAGRILWDPLDGGMSGSGDLGYTYGYAGNSEDSTSYLRIWRRRPGREWKIILDVVI